MAAPGSNARKLIEPRGNYELRWPRLIHFRLQRFPRHGAVQLASRLRWCNGRVPTGYTYRGARFFAPFAVSPLCRASVPGDAKGSGKEGETDRGRERERERERVLSLKKGKCTKKNYGET